MVVETLSGVDNAKASDNPGLRVRIPPLLKEQWGAFCEDKKIGQQDAILALIRWLMSTDDLVQSMVLGQVRASPDLARVVADRLASGAVDGVAGTIRAQGQIRGRTAASEKPQTKGQLRDD